MRQARIYVHGIPAGILLERERGSDYLFRYNDKYDGPPVSLAMTLSQREYHFEGFPPFFEGLLPEGEMLEGLLRQNKIDRSDTFAQLVAVGQDTIGAITIQEESV